MSDSQLDPRPDRFDLDPVPTMPLAIRAVLRKEGSPDVQYEVQYRDGFSFDVFANGRASAFWPRFSPQELMSGSARRFDIHDAFARSLAQNFAGHAVTNVQELSA